MQITTQYALIVQEAITWAWWISPTVNQYQIGFAALCYVSFFCAFIWLIKPPIKLMQSPPRKTLLFSSWNEATVFCCCCCCCYHAEQLSPAESHVSKRPRSDQQPARPERVIGSMFQIHIATLGVVNFNGNVISFQAHSYVLMQRAVSGGR